MEQIGILRNKKQLISLAVLIFLVVAIPLTMYIIRQQQIFKGRAVGANSRIAFLNSNNQEIQSTLTQQVKLRLFWDSGTNPRCLVNTDCPDIGVPGSRRCMQGVCAHADPGPTNSPSPSPTPVTGLSAPALSFNQANDLICIPVVGAGIINIVVLSWTISSPAPNSFILKRDGVVVSSTIGSDARRYGDNNVSSGAHLYTIQGVWSQGAGPVSNTVSVTVNCT